MSIYTEPGLKLDFFDPNGRNATLLEEIRYEVGYKGSGIWIVVPKGFVTDGASVPRPLWALLPPWGTKASKAAIIHDFLLVRMDMGLPWPGFETRKAIDDEFLIAMIAIGVPVCSAQAVHKAVRSWSIIKPGVSFLRLP